MCVREHALDSPLVCFLPRALCAGTALDDAVREGHNKVAEGLAGYYRVMDHSVQMDQSVKSAKVDQSLRHKAETLMLGEEKTRTGQVRVETTPSGSETPSETQSGKPSSGPADRLASQAAAVKNANRAATKYVNSAAKK